MNVYVRTDLEGASGLWRGSQVAPLPNQAGDYAYGRRCLAWDVNQVVDAAFEGGARRVVVADCHGPGGLDWDQVDPRAALEKPGGLAAHKYPSFADGFDCVLDVGRHAMAGTRNAFLEHTQSSRNWFEFRINGRPQGELGIFAAYAGGFGVPIALVTGDRAACAEAADLLPYVVTAEVKYAMRRQRGVHCYPRADVQTRLREATAAALQRTAAGEAKPWRPDTPLELELTLQRTDLGDDMETRAPAWQRVSGRTFRRRIDDPKEIYCW